MRFAINVPNFGPFSDPRLVANLARDAEKAGWDGFFVWDHVVFMRRLRLHVADPWVLLTAATLATDRIRLGPMVTPLPRRRPWNVARQAATLDRLSGGRMALGVGLADPAEDELGAFGEATDLKLRAAMLDEGLEVITQLWSGQPVTHHGPHYRLDDVAFLPTPAQQPRIPIWVAGIWPRRGAFRRAARWDGVAPLKLDPAGEIVPLSADDLRGVMAAVRAHRTVESPFDVIVGGTTNTGDPAAARARLEELAAAGMTWWSEGVAPVRTDVDAFVKLVRSGPMR